MNSINSTFSLIIFVNHYIVNSNFEFKVQLYMLVEFHSVSGEIMNI